MVKSENRPARRCAKLTTIGGCTKEMAKAYRQILNGQLDSSEALRRCKVLAFVREGIETREFEERLDALEKTYGGGAGHTTFVVSNGGV